MIAYFPSCISHAATIQDHMRQILRTFAVGFRPAILHLFCPQFYGFLAFIFALLLVPYSWFSLHIKVCFTWTAFSYYFVETAVWRDFKELVHKAHWVSKSTKDFAQFPRRFLLRYPYISRNIHGLSEREVWRSRFRIRTMGVLYSVSRPEHGFLTAFALLTPVPDREMSGNFPCPLCINRPWV